MSETWFANALFVTVFLGVLFAIAISAGVDRLQRSGIPRGIGAALIVISFFAFLFGFGAWMAPTLRDQGAELRLKLPEAVDRIEEWVNRRQSGMSGVLDSGGGPPSLKGRIASQFGGASKYLFPFLSHTAAAIGGSC